MRGLGLVLSAAAAAIACSGCSFSKDPYLFTSLADVPLVIVPDGAADAGVAEDSGVADEEAGVGAESVVPDSGPRDAMVFPDAQPVYHTGKAVHYTAIDQGLRGTGSGFLPSDGAARTVEAWVRGMAGPRSGRILGYGVMGHQFEFWAISSPGASNGHLILVDGFNAVTSGDQPALGDDAWHHIALTMTASAAPDGNSSVTFYIDGVADTTVNKGNNDVQHDDARVLLMGGVPGDEIGFSNMELDEVRLWSIERTGAEIARDRATIIDSAPGLVGYWAMDEIGAGPGIAVMNKATVTGTTAAPSLFTIGGLEFIDSTAF